jgi:hypothetical protein
MGAGGNMVRASGYVAGRGPKRRGDRAPRGALKHERDGAARRCQSHFIYPGLTEFCSKFSKQTLKTLNSKVVEKL